MTPNLEVNRPIVFIHVPKCAGSSIRKVLREKLGNSVLLHYRDENKNLNPKPITKLEAEKVVEKYGQCIIYGHFNSNREFGVYHSVPWATQFVTVLREPFEQVVSAFKYANKSTPELIDCGNFERYLSKNPPNYLNHFPIAITHGNYKEVILNSFRYIGFDFDLEKFLKNFLIEFGIDYDVKSPVLNKSAEYNDTFYSSYRDFFEKKNSLEMKVYNFAKKIWYNDAN